MLNIAAAQPFSAQHASKPAGPNTLLPHSRQRSRGAEFDFDEQYITH